MIGRRKHPLDRVGKAEDRLIEIAPGVHAERGEDGSIAIMGTGADVRAFLDSAPPNTSAAQVITGAYHAAWAKAKGDVR